MSSHVSGHAYFMTLRVTKMHLVSCPDPTSKEEKGLVNLGQILGPALRNFHAPIRSLLWHCHVTSLPQECNIAILAVQAKLHMQSC